MLTVIVLTLAFFIPVSAQDAMQYGVKHLKVLAEDDKVRVLRYAPAKGHKTPIHSHPKTVMYVVKGGKVRLTLPDGTSSIGELKSGDVPNARRSPTPTKPSTILK